ncbi:MAG: hypothetical protein ABI619_11825 [Betaproteobacteria bacterium]
MRFAYLIRISILTAVAVAVFPNSTFASIIVDTEDLAGGVGSGGMVLNFAAVPSQEERDVEVLAESNSSNSASMGGLGGSASVTSSGSSGFQALSEVNNPVLVTRLFFPQISEIPSPPVSELMRPPRV